MSNALSAEQIARARKNLSEILRCAAIEGQEKLGAAIGKDSTTVSKMFSDGRIEQFATLLAAMGLKVVSEKYRCIDPDTLAALLHGHRQWLGSIESPEQLTWD